MEWGCLYKFSGGKDSTVLKHIIDSMYNDVPSIFVNTGLEYPEIQKFVNDIKKGCFKCFNNDITIKGGIMYMFDMELLKMLKEMGNDLRKIPDVRDTKYLCRSAYEELVRCYQIIIDMVEDL